MNVLIIALVVCIAVLGYLIGKYWKLKNNSIEALKRQYWEEISNGQKELVMTQKQVKEARTQLAAAASKLQDVQQQLSEGRRQRTNLQKEIQLQEEKIEFQTKNYERVIMAEKEASLSKMRADIERENSQLQVAYQKKADELKHKYEEEETQHLQSLKNLEKVLRESADKTKEELNSEIEQIKAELEDYRQRRAAINEQIRKEEELKNEQEFHRIQLSALDKDDISYLLSIEYNIHNKQLLYKLIWSEYLQKPFNQMIKNIMGENSPKNVIYCIENINTHKKYIGKTKQEASKRWSDHIKTSLKDRESKLLYKNLFNHWDEFTFSILEEVENSDLLGEREKFYINFYQSNIYGYNMVSGG